MDSRQVWRSRTVPVRTVQAEVVNVGYGSREGKPCSLPNFCFQRIPACFRRLYLEARSITYDQEPDYKEFIRLLMELKDEAEEGPLDLTKATILDKSDLQSSHDATMIRTFRSTERVLDCTSCCINSITTFLLQSSFFTRLQSLTRSCGLFFLRLDSK